MSNRQKVLIVEDDSEMRGMCVRILSRAGYQATAAPDGAAGLATLREDPTIRCALVDLRLPKMDGAVLLEKIKEFDDSIKVVIMTGHATVKSAVQTMKMGAVDYLVKPFEMDELLAVVAQQFRVGELELQVQRLRTELRGKYSFDNIVGRSKKMEVVFEQIVAARNNKANVLITGESGTGKELIARAIHYNGQTAEGPFVVVNCAALPQTLIESELFGHVKGAFTGATRDSIGLFRTADGGTAFLDEIFEMPLDTQAKLLRVIQEQTVRPVGGLMEMPVSVRIIAATNRDPADALEQDRIRVDLFYRLSVITIQVPPLRERREDIVDLVDHFSARFAKAYDFRIGPICQRVLDILNRYHWPGNARELENLVERWFAMGRKDTISADDLPVEMIEGARSAAADIMRTDSDRVPTLCDAERALALRALVAADHNKSKAANLLGISRKKLYKLLSEDERPETTPSC